MSDLAAVKQTARGRWLEILPALAGIPADVLDGKHHPCPKCGGTDRFRALDDFRETGAVYCNGCFSNGNGDGIAAIQHYSEIDFKTAIPKLTNYLGVQARGNGNGLATNGKVKKPADRVTLTKGIESIKPADHAAILEMYCNAKSPITPEGVRQCGGTLVKWHNNECMRFDGRASLNNMETTAIVLLRTDGMPFPPAGGIGERKTHSTKGSANSWITSGDLIAAETVFDVEGITDLLAAASVGLPHGWIGVTNTAGANARHKLPRPWAKGKRVIVAGDADEPGLKGQRRSIAAYHKAEASEVFCAHLPYPVEKDHGKDLRDFLREGRTISELPSETTSANDYQDGKDAVGCIIIVGTDESRVVDEAIAALAPLDNVYQRGGSLVHVVVGANTPPGIARPKNAPRIAPMRQPRLREKLSDAATWVRRGEDDKFEQIHPPDRATKAVDARGQWQTIRALEAVVESPVLRADGTILQTPGYDSRTGLLFLPYAPFPPAKDQLTRDDAVAAAQAMLEVVEDFPFGTDAHRAAWLAATLTPIARYAFYGCAPLFLIDANVRGCGKSLLSDVTSQTVAGREMARMSLPRDDDEFRKRITALAVAGEPLILLDNIVGTLGSASLDAALTATSWSDRILGQTAMASGVPLFATWYATGNNIVLAADTARRTLHIRLESPEENPEERSGFRHSNLLEWVRQERPRLAVAAVTILAAYCAAGRPSMNLTPWGSFEEWSALVREAIVWTGLPDPASTRTELVSQADREAIALRQLIAGWDEIDPSRTGMTVAKVLTALAQNPDDYATLRDALIEMAPPKDGKTFNARSIGMKLHHLRRRVVDGVFLNRRDDRVGAVWQIEQPEKCRTSATSGTNSNPSRAHAHTHAPTRNPVLGENSPASPVSPAGCLHTDVEESLTFDGYINRRCRACGADLPCRKPEKTEK